MRRFITDIIFIILSITFMIYLFMVYFADFDSLSYGLLYIFIISLHITFIILYLCFILSEENLKVYDNFISEDNQANIETIVNHFNQNKTNYSIALLGKWGCGKTYLWEHFIRPKIAIKYELITANLAKSIAIVCGLFLLACLNDDLIKLIRTYFCVSYFDFFKPIFLFPILLGLFIYIRIFSSYKNSIIYISLYGKNDFKSAIDEIYQKSQDSKDYLIRLLNGLSSKITGIENLFYKLDEDGFEDKIICIDDIERRPKSMGLEDVFGLVSHLKEIKKCHVLAIFGVGVDKNFENNINNFINHNCFEKTFNLKLNMNSNYYLIVKLINKSSIKLSHKGIEELIKFICSLEEYIKCGEIHQINIRCFMKIFCNIEAKLRKLNLLELDKDFLEFYYADIFERIYNLADLNLNTGYFGHVFWHRCRQIIVNSRYSNLDYSYNDLINCYKTYKHLNIMDEFYAAFIGDSLTDFLGKEISGLQVLFLLRLAYKNKCNNKKEFEELYEDIFNYIILKKSETPELINVIRLLEKYDFANDIDCNEEIKLRMKSFAAIYDRNYFNNIGLRILYDFILSNQTQGFETINNSYFKVSLELLLALLLDLDTQNDEDNKVINKLKEILGISSIE
ncbi:hypothetical protein [Campylobacter sp. RM12651]|uniref:hypothetical protein n=1 Tax=Campylobacter sp. RM12651 TaxID=1660079 RepID=UPI001EFBCBA5|nr:hypothetical protein [Campylobacter sp. RM12651]ULO02606.1 putative membrane protein [Campylobacter sp. RM12651]